MIKSYPCIIICDVIKRNEPKLGNNMVPDFRSYADVNDETRHLSQIHV